MYSSSHPHPNYIFCISEPKGWHSALAKELELIGLSYKQDGVVFMTVHLYPSNLSNIACWNGPSALSASPLARPSVYLSVIVQIHRFLSQPVRNKLLFPGNGAWPVYLNHLLVTKYCWGGWPWGHERTTERESERERGTARERKGQRERGEGCDRWERGEKERRRDRDGTYLKSTSKRCKGYGGVMTCTIYLWQSGKNRIHMPVGRQIWTNHSPFSLEYTTISLYSASLIDVNLSSFLISWSYFIKNC